MALDRLGVWAPMEIEEAIALFATCPVRWWIAGGHALELHLGASWRAHDDIDISICRSDVHAIPALLLGWDIHIAAAGTLTPWDGSALAAESFQNNLWCRRTPSDPWCLDLTIADGNHTSWIYRRNPSITRPWNEAILRSPRNVPYLAPDLQLLFKSDALRTKDDHDAATVIPALDETTRDRLGSFLTAQHPWQRLVGQALATEAAQHLGIEGAVTELAAGRSSQAWRVGEHTVVRVPLPNSGRLLSYRSEKVLGDRMHEASQIHVGKAAKLATWQLLNLGTSLCSVAPLLPGRPVDYSERWDTTFAGDLGTTLHTLHSLAAEGFGPLANTDGPLVGTSATRRSGIVDRWFHARIWPFDLSVFTEHVVHRLAPDIGELALGQRQAILDAEAGPHGIVHSDLHREHLLVNKDGGLGGLLDLGDAFIGALAWDFALLWWYYGDHNVRLVADHYPGAERLLRDGRILALAVGLYKLAKSPDDPTVLARLRSAISK